MTRYHNINGQDVAFSAEEELAKDAEEAAWADQANARAMAGLREERNRRLAETDHHALSDQTLSDEMRSYRAALRDMPATAASDPGNPTWPEKPS
jgi:hypothetical protein